MRPRSKALLEDSAGTAVAAAARAVVALYKPLLEPLHLTYPQYLVLLALDTAEPQSAMAVANRLYLSPGTITPLLRRLANFGYITRTRNLADERLLSIAMTPAGQDLLPTLWELGDRVHRALNEQIPDLPDVTASLNRLARSTAHA